MSGDHGLEVRGVSLTLDGQPVLRDVDLVIGPGELVALVGPNGAGKSSLLGVVVGDHRPDTGTVEFAGAPLAGLGAREAARQRSVLLQETRLAFGFRVEDVVRMGRTPWHRTPAEDSDDEMVATAMLRADVADLADRLFPTLSGGEKARVSFARVLAQATPLVLLDEPTAALDIRHQEQVLGVARSLADAGAAVGVVLHDLTLAAAWADRICVLSEGRVAADGAPVDVLVPDLLAEVYRHPVDVIVHDGRPIVVPSRKEAVACQAAS
ncbi:MAG TPA: heme ABC transporter ATP-binding protein [Marmoricola sp.]